jgi:hypothetical protein
MHHEYNLTNLCIGAKPKCKNKMVCNRLHPSEQQTTVDMKWPNLGLELRRMNPTANTKRDLLTTNSLQQ